MRLKQCCCLAGVFPALQVSAELWIGWHSPERFPGKEGAGDSSPDTDRSGGKVSGYLGWVDGALGSGVAGTVKLKAVSEGLDAAELNLTVK